ncbi:hypothetical protein ACF0H5_011119 [Mactra antiquata]
MDEVTAETDSDTEVETVDDKVLNTNKRKLRSRSSKPVKRMRFKSSGGSSRKYACTKCDYVGKMEKHLQNHLARKHQRHFKCNVCNKKYGYKADLDRHKIEVHNKTANYYCKICDKYLKTKAYIDDHMSMHADNYVYQCKTCDKSFSTKQVFGKHMKFKHPGVLFDVDELDEVLPESASDNKAENTLKDDQATNDEANDGIDGKHLDKNDSNDASQDMDYLFFAETKDKIIHENNLVKVTLKKGKNRGRPRIKSFVDGRTEFPCNLCNYIGKKECHLEYHIIRNHSQKFICDICQKQFGYNWDLKRHREQVHAEASYICHICSKAYKVKKSFDEHLKSHEEGYVKSVFPCTICDKTFSAKQVLDNHVKFKHLGQKQKEKQKYLCQTCGAEFYHKYSYQSHMNKHAGLTPYNCDICGKAFASEHSVKEHQITHKNLREFHCHICPKSFKTSSALNAHVAIHNNKRDFKCSVCNKGFIQKQSLIRHERIHSGYKPYTCGLCARVFTDSATIRKHMILVHKSDPHDWQGDVISDLKKQGDLWQGDLTSEPKKEPDFRRKADRERIHNSTTSVDKVKPEHMTGVPVSSFQENQNEMSQGNDCKYSDVNPLNNQNNLHSMVDMNQSGSSNNLIDNNTNTESNRQSNYWRNDGFLDGHRSNDTWNPGNMGRQQEQVRVDGMMGMKRPGEYFPQGIVLDATRHGNEYFHGDNIPDPRKQIEFWQGQTIPDGKQHQSDQLQNQLTTLQNMNYHSQS